MERESITFETLWRSWLTYAYRLAMTIPEDGIAELEGRERRRRRTGSWVLWVLIGVLAIASITNLSDRAYIYKEGWASYVIGAGLALLVPAAVHYAIKTRDWWKYVVWVFAGLFAFMSASIQYQIYAPVDAPFALTKDHLEALAFGAGVPLAECLLAAIAAIVVLQDDKREAESEAEAALATADEEKLAREREREDRLFAMELENKRLDAQAKREERLIKAQAKVSKVVPQNVQRDVQQGVQHGGPTTGGTLSEQAQRAKIIKHLQDNGWTGGTALAAAVGIGKSTLYTRLTELSERGLVVNKNRKWDVVRDITPALPAAPAVHLNGSGVTHDQP